MVYKIRGEGPGGGGVMPRVGMTGWENARGKPPDTVIHTSRIVCRCACVSVCV